jgi:Ino eighty subunit 2
MPLTGVKHQMDTINKLLKKQAPKRRGRAGNPTTDTTNNNTGGDATPPNGEVSDAVMYEKPNRVFVRWISNAQGSRVGVPEEWLGESVGSVFCGGGIGGGRMVEEVN